jgi:hypothetical protein
VTCADSSSGAHTVGAGVADGSVFYPRFQDCGGGCGVGSSPAWAGRGWPRSPAPYTPGQPADHRVE